LNIKRDLFLYYSLLGFFFITLVTKFTDKSYNFEYYNWFYCINSSNWFWICIVRSWPFKFILTTVNFSILYNSYILIILHIGMTLVAKIAYWDISDIRGVTPYNKLNFLDSWITSFILFDWITWVKLWLALENCSMLFFSPSLI